MRRRIHLFPLGLAATLLAGCVSSRPATPHPDLPPADESRKIQDAYFKKRRTREQETARARDTRYDELCGSFQQAIYSLMKDKKYAAAIDLMNRHRDRIDTEDLYWGKMRNYRLGELPYWMGHCHHKLGNGVAAYYWLKICKWNCWGSWDARASRLMEKVVAGHGAAITAYEERTNPSK